MSNAPDFTQTILNIKTGGVYFVKNGKLADGYHVIHDAEYLVLTVVSNLPQIFERNIGRDKE
jgi:hypothetical protein